MGNNSDYGNKREFTRVPVTVCVEMTAGQQVIRSRSSRDISMNGLFIETPEKTVLGEHCTVIVYLGDWDSSFQIRIRGIVARVDDTGIGVEFIEILGMESFQHLQNLVISNSGEATARIEQEMARHIGIRRPHQPEPKPAGRPENSE